MAVQEELGKIVGSENVIDDQEILEEYSKDHSFAPPLKPHYVVRPKDLEEVQEIAKWADETLTPLIPVSSAPPRYRGDTVPSVGGSVVIDLGNMKKILRIDRRNRVALIEAGVTFSELIPALEKEGLRPYMPLLPRGTKSVVASVLEREPTLIPRGHWDGMDPMLNAEIVYPSGEMMRTGSAQIDTLEEQWEHKRAQVRPGGPGQVGFSRLVGGAQGTMGIVTWEAIRCRILPTLQRLYMIPSADIDPLVNTAYKILRHRYGDEVFFLNNLALAAVVEKKPEDIKALANELPEWVLMVGIAGYEFFPEERMEYQEEDIRDMAAEFAVVLRPAIAGAKGPEIIKLLSKPSEEPYWKNRLKGACHDIFFITTLDQVSKYVAIMHELAESFQYPTTDIGVYIQPMTQGVYCHCEFNLTCDPGNQFEVDTVKKLLTEGAKALADRGAFFSRPYYGWADIAYNHISSENVVLLKKAKAVFDPNGILNPGKLCF